MLLSCMNISITPTQDVITDSSHNSEGVIFRKSDGNLLHIYRRDPNAAGDHTGNTGALYQSTYDIGSEIWGTRTVFYDDAYDDRNPAGGITDDGRFVLFFRRYNDTTSTTVDTRYLYSDDEGATWSSQTVLTTGLSVANPYGGMIDIYDNPTPTKRYLKGFLQDSTSYKISVQFSQDGSSWGNEVVVADYTVGHAYNVSEPWFVYIGGGKIICLSRDNTSAENARYYQMTSSDYGITWTAPSRTNIAANHWMVSPVIINHNGQLIILASDRRSDSSTGTRPNEGIWIFTGYVNTVFSSPTSYISKAFRYRPLTTSALFFYGYPTIAQVSDSRYLVVFTDRYTDSFPNEGAHLYQFYLDITNDTPIIGQSYSFPAFATTLEQ